MATIEKYVSYNNNCQISGYRLMNFIQKSNDLCRNRNDFNAIMKSIKTKIHIVGIDTHGMYSIEENQNTFTSLKKIDCNVYYHEMESNFGNEAYLKETQKIASFLQPIFNSKQISIRSKFNYHYVNA
jgi:homoserine O-acetyltransferase